MVVKASRSIFVTERDVDALKSIETFSISNCVTDELPVDFTHDTLLVKCEM